MQKTKNILNSAILSELKRFPNPGILFEIIERGITGKIIKLPNKNLLIKENCNDPFVFIAGGLTDESISFAADATKDVPFPRFCCAKKYQPLFLEAGWRFQVRVQLTFNKNEKKIPERPKNSKILKIDSLDVFRKCTWHKERKALYGGDDHFIKYGTGYALLIDDVLVSEAYASIGAGHGEIGVITAPEHRGKKYAAYVVNHLICELLDKNIKPDWSCNIDNISSLKTAFKLGFQISSYYTLLVRPNAQ